jgi:hypothetical protein
LKGISEIAVDGVVDFNLAAVAVPGHPARRPRAEGAMYLGKFVFAQVMDHLPLHAFHRSVARYSGEHKIKRFSCLDQYLSMAFAQLTYRESLRDIEACLRTQSSKLYHLGFRSPVARNTLANANATRDWRIYCDFAQSLIGTARRLYADEVFGLDLKDTVYALDATTIDLCLSVFPWAPFRSTKGGYQAAHVAGSAREYPVLHLHQRREAA